MQNEHRINEAARVLAHPCMAFVQRAEQAERHLFNNIGVGHVRLAHRWVGTHAIAQLVGHVGQIGSIGLNRTRSQAFIVAGPRTREHVAVDLAGMQVPVQRRAVAAHGMAHDEQRSLGVFGNRAVDHDVDVFRDFIKGGIEDLGTLRTAMAAMVEAVHRIALRVQAHSEIVVAALMLAQAVHDNHHAARIGHRIGLAEKLRAIERFERVFLHHGDSFLPSNTRSLLHARSV